MKSKAKVSKKKVKEVKELVDLLKKSRTVLVASVKNLPASQFQDISKKLRGKAIVKLPKKNLIFRAIDETKDSDLAKIKDFIMENSVILFSDIDAFELAGELTDKKSPARAKVGQEAPEDIKIEQGPTDLMSGPVISEFGALGIPIQIDKGKIVVKETKIIARKGEKISENAAGMMSKLDIKPFSIGFVPLSAFDTNEKKIYSEINIDKSGAILNLKNSFGKSLAFAVQIGYASKDTIKFIIAKAAHHEKSLSKLLKNQTPEQNTGEENK